MTDDEGDGARRGPLIALGAVVALLVVGWLLARALYDSSRLEDCLLSGRTNCAPVEIPRPWYRLYLIADSANDLEAYGVCATGNIRFRPGTPGRMYLFAIYCRNEIALRERGNRRFGTRELRIGDRREQRAQRDGANDVPGGFHGTCFSGIEPGGSGSAVGSTFPFTGGRS